MCRGLTKETESGFRKSITPRLLRRRMQTDKPSFGRQWFSGAEMTFSDRPANIE